MRQSHHIYSFSLPLSLKILSLKLLKYVKVWVFGGCDVGLNVLEMDLDEFGPSLLSVLYS